MIVFRIRYNGNKTDRVEIDFVTFPNHQYILILGPQMKQRNNVALVVPEATAFVKYFFPLPVG